MRAITGALTVFSAMGLAAQEPLLFEVSLRDGTVLAGRAPQIRGGRLELNTAQGGRSIPLGEVLAVHGEAVLPVTIPAFHLAGGEVVRGLPVGGDPKGEWVEVRSPSLGVQRLVIDRLQGIRFRPDLATLDHLVLPEGADEALFTKAAIGFDIITGDLHEIAADRIRFQPKGEESPRVFRIDQLVGFRLAAPLARTAPGPVQLLTRSGDRVDVRLLAWEKHGLRIQREDGGEAVVPETSLACATFAADDVIWLSSLQPEVVDETGFGGPALLPWQRDLSVVGTPLSCAGRAFGRGLGVHSKSRLGFRVPAGARWFWTRVGIDDSALGLGPRAAVDIRVRVDGEEVFAQPDVRSGEAQHSTGLLSVTPGALLELEVDFGRGRDLADRVGWFLPVFLPAPGGE